MSIIARMEDSANFQQVKPGMYVARCVSMIELGTIEEEYKGVKKKQRKVIIRWELPTEKTVFNPERGEEPFSVAKTYTISMHPDSNLRKDLESWRGVGFTEEQAEAFDITALLGVPCMLNIIQKPSKSNPGRHYTTISSINKVIKGMEVPAQINPTKMLSFNNFNWELFESLSDYTKDKIKSSEEFQAMQEPGLVPDRETGVDEFNNLPDDIHDDYETKHWQA